MGGLLTLLSTRRATLFFGVVLPIALLAPVACKQQELTPEQALVQKGRTLYSLRCASCHHPSNPALDGALGPDVAGSSRELLEARLLRGEYPPGYTPKRLTRVMQKLPTTPQEMDALYAFLNDL
jgi:mono/diheme cytochrome c family protein